ncbi:MAG: sugar ABC transporter substrate-binding protein [Eubacteriales bacterium]|nr:sugar ABC transporter substrate-binding protein [Eubacteriales bacterium]
MKRVTARILSISLALVIALGCFSFAAAEEQINLTFWGWEASALEAQSIQNGITAFEAANPNIHVDYMTVPNSEYHTKLKTAMASDSAPDVFYLDAAYTRDFANNGLLYDLTDVIGDYVDMNDLINSSIEKVSIAGADGQNHIYGMDICCVGPVIFYNKDLFQAAGVEPIPTTVEDRWTWDEFVENMKKLTIVENGKTTQYGTCNWEETSSLYVMEYMLRLNNAKWFNDDFTQAVGVTSEASKQVFEMIKALRTEYGVAPDPTAAGMETGNSPTQMFLSGKVASIAIGSYALQEISRSGINYGAGLFPVLQEGNNDFIASADMKAIWSGTKNLDAALKLLTYMSSEDFGTPIYKTGLWMPSRLSMYSEDKLPLWFDRTVYPEGWENMMDMFKTSSGKWFDKIWNTKQIFDAVDEEKEAYFYIDQDLDTTLTNIQNRINENLAK